MSLRGTVSRVWIRLKLDRSRLIDGRGRGFMAGANKACKKFDYKDREMVVDNGDMESREDMSVW